MEFDLLPSYVTIQSIRANIHKIFGNLAFSFQHDGTCVVFMLSTRGGNKFMPCRKDQKLEIFGKSRYSIQ